MEESSEGIIIHRRLERGLEMQAEQLRHRNPSRKTQSAMAALMLENFTSSI